MFCPKGKKGFTLVELLVVISIIAILSAVGFTVFQDARTKALAAKAKADLNSIKKAYEQNFDPSLNGGQGGYKQLSPGGDGNSPYFSGGKIPTPQGGGSYIVSGPDAPVPDNNTYVISADKNTGQACEACSAVCPCITSNGGTPAGTSSGSGGSCAVAGSELGNILNNGLVGYWKMDETSWTNDCSTSSVIDSSNSRINGKLCSSAGSTVAVPTAPPAYPLSNNSSFNSAGFFTRTAPIAGCFSSPGSALIAGDNTTSMFNLQTFTLAAWVRLTGDCTGNLMNECTVISKDGVYTLMGYHGQIGIYVKNTLVAGGSLTLDNQWHHIAATYDGSSVVLYKDGATVTTTAAANVYSGFTIPNSPLSIGGRGRGTCPNGQSPNSQCLYGGGPSCGYQFFPGYIDDVRIFNRALPVEDIVKVKDNPVAPCQ